MDSEIENVFLTSCLFNSKHKRFFGITFTDVRLQGNTVEIGNELSQENSETALVSKFASSQSVKSLFDKLGKIVWLKIFSVYIHNFSFMQLAINGVNFSDKFLLNTIIQEFVFFFESTKKTFHINLATNGVCLKLLKHGAEETCLAQASSDVLLKFICSDKGSIETVVDVDQLDINIYDSLPINFKERKNKDSSTNFIHPDLVSKILKQSPVKKCSFNLNNSSIKLIREQGKRAFHLQFSKTDLNAVKTDNDDLEVKLCLCEAISCSSSIQLLSLNRFTLITKIEQSTVLNLCLNVIILSEVNSCHLNFDEIEIDYWLNSFDLLSRRKHIEEQQRNESSFVDRILNQTQPFVKFSFSSDLNDMCIYASNRSNSTEVKCSLLRGKFSSMVEPDPLLRELNCEFLINSLICENVKSDGSAFSNEKDIFIKSLIFKLHYATLSEVKINCASDTVSIDLDYLLTLAEKFHSIKTTSPEENVTAGTSKRTNFSITHFALNSTLTTFFANNMKLHIGNAVIDSDSAKFSSVIKNANVNSLIPLKKNVEACETHNILNLSEIKCIFNHDTNEKSVTLTEEIYFQWNVYFHLILTDLIKSVKQKISYLKLTADKKSKPASSARINITFDGNINIGALLSSSGQTVRFHSSSFQAVSSLTKLDFKSDWIVVFFDEREIAKFEHPNVAFLNEDESSRLVSRKDVGLPLELKRNRLLLVSIENFRIVFPYMYNFAETFNERFITIIKWLRAQYRKQQTTERVAMDMLFRIQSGIMQVNDDPFEVKLRDNYELLEDEYRESLKRYDVLNKRLEELRKRNIVLASSKINELHTALAEKQAEIYIKRHKQLYNSVPARTRLFLISAESVEIKMFADSSLTGKEKLINLMREVDRESPFPEDIKFSSLWGRQVHAYFQVFYCQLRDFPKPMVDIKNVTIDGLLMGAEPVASSRALRTCYIDTAPSCAPLTLERSMTTVKFYHDLNMKADYVAYTHGACWEPVLQQLNICFESIIKPSRDPSPSLTWWDRMRFLFHGSLRIDSDNFSLFFHSSLNPYNNAEFIEISFPKSIIDWLIGRINVKGNLDLLIHTASKYDECRIIHLPNIKIAIELIWDCLGNQNDHHSVVLCAADKIPDYSSHQNHDSYRAFRSRHLSARVSIESSAQKLEKATDVPFVLLYSSTLKWLENQKSFFAGMARLTRKGKLFNNVKPRKTPFSRIFKSVRVTFCLHKLTVSYWSSFSKQLGCKITGRNLSHCAEHVMTLVPFKGELKRRPQPVWELSYMNSQVHEVEMWLYNHQKKETETLDEDDKNRMYFLSLNRVSYNREGSHRSNSSAGTENTEDNDVPIHRLVLHGLKGAWTKDNKHVVMSLFDMYMKVEQLKRNLSTDALKQFKVDNQDPYTSGVSPVKPFYQKQKSSPASTMNKGNAASMLQKLIAESEANPNVVYTEDIESEICSDEPKLKGIAACSDDDVIQKNWLIELINSQVMLRGSETSGYVIASSAKTQIWQNIHRPVWKERTLFSKSTWVGSIECMQYYGTVEAGGTSVDNENIVWLNVENIEEKDSMLVNDIPDLVGSGRSAGGVVTSVVGSCDVNDCFEGTSPIQLQRIISRCGCKFFYVNYTEGVDIEFSETIPPLPEDNDLLLCEPWDKEVAVDSFTLMHYDLDISTNSQQYSMIMDLVNNLLLYVEPHKKEAYEKLQRMRFRILLSSTEEQKEPILQLQDELRARVAELKRLQTESYVIQKMLEDQSTNETIAELLEERAKIEKSIEKCKEDVNNASDELAFMISCFKEAQLSADKTRERQLAEEGGAAFIPSVIRRIEICFKQASWRLTDSDGQLGLSDVVLSNFLYTKVAKNDESVEHTLQLGSIYVLNLLPNPIYRTVLQPTELKPNIPLDRHYALRVFCREMAPVGGISVKEHFEVNVIPLTLSVTKAFYDALLNFFFPKRAPDRHSAVDSRNEPAAKGRKKHKMKKEESTMSVDESSSSISIPTAVAKSMTGDDIEKMRERALKNQTFVYIKIPEVPIRVSYKGRKEKSIANINNFSLILPSIEFHNQTWTWLDLLMAIKNESKHRLVSQAVKQKLQIKPSFLSLHSNEEKNDELKEALPNKEDDEQKAKLLLGDLAVGGQTKSKRLSIFSHRKQ
ncbi:hypothetical protein B4U79_01668 [Dinothrombium tinctorium]|uniref:FMP27/BLTP2/Hobbit GFWDK motif-containing RBG unit domain-containing protein n=1 Tax=Dinothrombium tinctorium TaxID=1965070 RepID=A0A443RR72_9ACAR|nr:hypothetical protein B4U79_01668 [Dinothrombium tinctorium]